MLATRARTVFKIVQERLGHSTIAVTLDTYSHVVPGLQEAAAKAFDQVLFTCPPNRECAYKAIEAHPILLPGLISPQRQSVPAVTIRRAPFARREILV